MKLSATLVVIAAIVTILNAVSCSNDAHQNADNNEKEGVAEKTSLERVAIPGTGVSMVPPTGTKLAQESVALKSFLSRVMYWV